MATSMGLLNGGEALDPTILIIPVARSIRRTKLLPESATYSPLLESKDPWSLQNILSIGLYQSTRGGVDGIDQVVRSVGYVQYCGVVIAQHHGIHTLEHYAGTQPVSAAIRHVEDTNLLVSPTGKKQTRPVSTGNTHCNSDKAENCGVQPWDSAASAQHLGHDAARCYAPDKSI